MNKKRYLIKLSGEAVKGNQTAGISWEATDNFCKRIAKIIKSGVELGFVIGGGNIFRGASQDIANYDRLVGDQIGMMSTIINALAFKERMQANGIDVLIQSGIRVEGVAGLFDKNEVEDIFKKGGAVVFCGGLGIPYFSTDTTSALRALQIGADFVFKATKVDGVYDKDPQKFNDAKFYDNLTFDEVIRQELKIMDMSSILLMKENNLKLMVFNMSDGVSLEKACNGKKVGTLVER